LADPTPSPELFALPDNQVIENLLPGICDRRIGVAEARDKIRRKASLWPLAVQSGKEEPLLYFADLGREPWRDWQHIFSVERLVGSGMVKEYFSTPVTLLDDEGLLPEERDPRGFIFHVSRCGSTLMGKALASVETFESINQPSVLQHGFWEWITRGWRDKTSEALQGRPLNPRRFQNLIYLLTRPRVLGTRHTFIKFISWNSIFTDFIREAFPEVPALFMYRHPAEVIASVARKTTAALVGRDTPKGELLTGASREEIEGMSDLVYLSRCYNQYFQAVLNAGKPPKLLNYRNLHADRVAEILVDAFNLQLNPAQVEMVVSPFLKYSKDDRGQTVFQDDSKVKLAMFTAEETHTIASEISGTWERLLHSGENIGMR